MALKVLPNSLEGIPMTFELVRDQLLNILEAELANQQTLAATPALFEINVFKEVSNPWDLLEIPCVNVWYDTGDILGAQSAAKSDQQGDHFYNMDVYVKKPKTEAERGDVLAALEAQRVGRVVYQIIMAEINYNLQFPIRPSVIGHRLFRQITTIQPVFGDLPVENVAAMRMRLEVRHDETPPTTEGKLLEGYDFIIRRSDSTVAVDIPVSEDY